MRYKIKRPDNCRGWVTRMDWLDGKEIEVPEEFLTDHPQIDGPCFLVDRKKGNVRKKEGNCWWIELNWCEPTLDCLEFFNAL